MLSRIGAQSTFLILIGVAVPTAVTQDARLNDTVGQTLASVSGRVTVLDEGNKLARDVSDAVVWLESINRLRPDSIPIDTVEILMSKKEFRPHVVVVTKGSTVRFPNQDPFNHNVFSRSENAPFDLGRYARGRVGSTDFPQSGIVRVFCNVHARMSAIVVVLDEPLFAQPVADGAFAMAVPPGTYILHAWHERAKTFRPRRIVVDASGVGDVRVELDARDYQFVQHVNKYGQPYSRARRGRRY